ncbi:uncharacterized protein [Diadema setosum]|uniref:uncharacterized protein n=1 Tax=Diadema setosum TaxID=31175 RepID=UPI003B3BD821
MKLVVCTALLLSTASFAAGCISQVYHEDDTSSEIGHQDAPVLHDTDSNDIEDTYADVWLGSLEFFDFWCGIPQSTYIEQGGSNVARRKRKRRESHDPVIDINTYKLDHSFVYFRGVAYEFGPGRRLTYTRGGLQRNVTACPMTTWTEKGRSSCSSEQVETMASGYIESVGGYNLLFNNCHHFAKWLLQKLVSNECELSGQNDSDYS